MSTVCMASLEVGSAKVACVASLVAKVACAVQVWDQALRLKMTQLQLQLVQLRNQQLLAGNNVNCDRNAGDAMLSFEVRVPSTHVSRQPP